MCIIIAAAAPATAQINTVQELAPGIYFHEGDFRRGHCNNGWIVVDDFVLVVDANFPSGAKVVMPKIKETSDKPVRFAFDTHHHGDHAYGNQVWADAGATIVAHTGVAEEMAAKEPAGWNNSAKNRPDVAESRLKAPTVRFPDQLIFDDGERRIELRHFGIGHTKGDAFVWLPKEKILFTGDACVNGAYNYLADATVSEWIKTLERVKELGAEVVCPGHGAKGGPEIIADQQAYFQELWRHVAALKEAGKSAAEAKAALPQVAAEMKKIRNIARYVPGSLNQHGEKVWREMGGEAFPR